MYLGTRAIRSAGRTSGSIEITLPPELHVLMGLSCRLVLRDGLSPEIVLLPDLSAARAALGTLWRKLCGALASIEAVDEFPLDTFAVTLLPASHWRGHLPLAYADVLLIVQNAPEAEIVRREALAHVLGALSAKAGRVLGLDDPLALAFADAMAYLVTGISVGFGTDFERSTIVNRIRWARPLGPSCDLLFGDEFWSECRPAFSATLAQFLEWQEQPEGYERARQRWYRAHSIETVQSPSVAHSKTPDRNLEKTACPLPSV